MSKPKYRTGDLGKIGNQFVVLYQLDPMLIIPIYETNPAKHRTDVVINDAELFCMKKPMGELTVKLSAVKQIDPKLYIRIGKCGKSVMMKIDFALTRERRAQATEQDNSGRVKSQFTRWN